MSPSISVISWILFPLLHFECKTVEVKIQPEDHEVKMSKGGEREEVVEESIVFPVSKPVRKFSLNKYLDIYRLMCTVCNTINMRFSDRILVGK